MKNCFAPIKKQLLKKLFLFTSMVIIVNTCLAQSNNLLSAWLGSIDFTNNKITNLPANGRVIQLTSAATVTTGATLRVINETGATVSPQSFLNNTFKVEITTPNNTIELYTIELGSTALAIESITDSIATIGSIINKTLSIAGKTTFHILNKSNPLQGSFVNITSEDTWLYFDNIKPAAFNKLFLHHITINNEPAVFDVNCRLVQWLQGCVIISQSQNYKPLQVFKETNFTGTSMDMDLYTYYRFSELHPFNNTISSFKLKKGYMATFADDTLGRGNSKVYVAQDNDILISSLPDSLKNRISFVRVFPWRWVSKKGWTSNQDLCDTLACSWNYNWNNDKTSTLDVEYVPIRQTRWWPGYAATNTKKNVTHYLGFNEPNSSAQANMTPNEAIWEWPRLMESGLRLGSPAITDGGAEWLYNFMDKADSANLRVDFVAVHFYRGCQSPTQFYSFLRSIHNRTGRPIWITEFNNGANWTNTAGCPKPTYAQEQASIQGFLNMLDTASFVERYSLYEWVEDTRQMFYNYTPPYPLTPAGVVYKNNISPMAYNPLKEYYAYPPNLYAPFQKTNLVISRFGNNNIQTGANAMYLDEYTTNGTLVRSIPLPTQKWAKNFAILSSGQPKSNSDGQLTQSADGNHISIMGYNTSLGSTNTNGAVATATPRTVAVIDSNANINTASSFNDVVSGHIVRSALFHNGGLYMSGGIASGIKYGKLGMGTHKSSTSIISTPGGTRKIESFGGDIYVSQYNAGLCKLFKIDSTPISPAIANPLPGIPLVTATNYATGYVLFDLNKNIAGYDVLYMVDETPAPSIIYKYINNGTQWENKGSFTVANLNDNVVRDMTGQLIKNIPTLYGVTFTSIAKFADMAAYDSTAKITQTILVNNPTTINSAFRGITFTPGTKRRTALPIIYSPTDTIVNCTENTSPIFVGNASLINKTDNYEITFKDVSNKGTITTKKEYYNYSIGRTWVAMDIDSNKNNFVQTIKVQDTTRPIVTAKNNIKMANASGQAIVYPEDIYVNAADACSPVTLSVSPSVLNAGQTYMVTLIATDASGNKNYAESQVKICDYSKSPFIFPNPVASQFTVVHSSIVNLASQLNIFNDKGEMVLSQKINSSNEVINVKHLRQGLYFVIIKNGTKIYTTKLQKL